ncbi:MAG TPA: DUF4330 domain-containing protein [Clostridiales bacterium]|nr:DUF4330 domain-containing protein [Clostridiales bacterium]
MQNKRRRPGFLDIVVLLVVIGIIAAAAYYFTHNHVGNSAASTGEQEITYVLEMKDVSADFVDRIIIGDKLYYTESDAFIGEVTAAEVIPYYADRYQDDKGTVDSAAVEGKYNARITVKANADISEAATTVNGVKVMVGSEVNARTSTVGGSSYCVELEEPGYDD